MVFWFFGYPGIGKDYLAEKLSQLASIPHISADDFLTGRDREKLLQGNFTQRDRIRKLKRIISHIIKLLPKHPCISAADSLPDNLSRNLLLKTFGTGIVFIYVNAPKSIHLSRLIARKGHFFTTDLLPNWIKKHWEPVEIPYISFENKDEHAQDLKRRLLSLYQKYSKNKV